MSSALDAEDAALLLVALRQLDRHTDRELQLARKEANRTKEAVIINMRGRMFSVRAKLQRMLGGVQ